MSDTEPFHPEPEPALADSAYGRGVFAQGEPVTVHDHEVGEPMGAEPEEPEQAPEDAPEPVEEPYESPIIPYDDIQVSDVAEPENADVAHDQEDLEVAE